VDLVLRGLVTALDAIRTDGCCRRVVVYAGTQILEFASHSILMAEIIDIGMRARDA